MSPHGHHCFYHTENYKHCQVFEDCVNLIGCPIPQLILYFSDFPAGPWAVEVAFEAAAPIVSSYHVTVDNLSTVIRWEGEVSYQGEIVEITYTH